MRDSMHSCMPLTGYLHLLLPLSQGESVGGQPWALQVLRSSQLDAARLDDELISMLHEQFMKIFSYFKPGQVQSLEPELNAVLLLLVGAAAKEHAGGCRSGLGCAAEISVLGE